MKMSFICAITALFLVVGTADASVLLFSDNFNINKIGAGSSESGDINWRKDAAGQPAYIPGQPATRQDGTYALTDYTEVKGQWYLTQVGSEEGDLPPELEPPNGSGR